MSHHTMQTERYWQAHVEQEIATLRSLKREEARKSIRTFAYVGFFAVLVTYAIVTMPTWLPPIVEFMEYYGVIPIQHIN